MNSLYILLFRHHQRYVVEMDRLGWLDSNLENTTVSFRIENEIAIYEIVLKRKLPTFDILDDEDETQTSTESDADVHSDLVEHQESSIRDRDTDSGSSYYAEDSDPSSSEGEICGSSDHASDWGTERGTASDENHQRP